MSDSEQIHGDSGSFLEQGVLKFGTAEGKRGERRDGGG